LPLFCLCGKRFFAAETAEETPRKKREKRSKTLYLHKKRRKTAAKAVKFGLAAILCEIP